MTTIGPPLTVYFDWDGVGNAWWADLVWPSKTEGIANGYRIIWSPDMIAALDAFVLEHEAIISWTTTWIDRAQTDIAPLVQFAAGMPEVSQVTMPLSGEVSFPSILWKRDAIRADQAKNPRPFIHIDDEVFDSGWGSGKPDGGMWAKEVELMGGLAICPDQQTGLSPLHLQRMHAYANSLKSAEVVLD